VLTPVVALLTATPAPETASTSGSDVERNRRLLHKWNADPEHAARLQRDLHAFWALPRARRQHLRQLDRAVHQLDDTTQKRLWKVAERYIVWRERLPEDERRKIDEAKDTPERLRVIKEIRERQWLNRLPVQVRADLDKLAPQARSAQVARLQAQERQQRKLWQRPIGAAGHAKQPAHLADFPADARNFIDKQLLPHLTIEERRQYDAAVGRWPEFARMVHELAQRHPVLPPLPHKTIARYEDLPEKAKVEAGPKAHWERRDDAWNRLLRVEGKWPEWALTFHALLSPQQRERMPPLGASRPSEFPKEIQTFIDHKLKPALGKDEGHKLHAVEGKWPDYPHLLLKLSLKYKLDVPGMGLPGGAELWDAVR
jgi:hypothetical protein